MIARLDEHCASAGTAAVVFLGGSITQGARASDTGKTSYRARVSAWLQARHPAAEVECHNAGIGGTGSDFGCCRLEQDVLALRPQLVFVEFAVNDASKPETRIARSYEGILRRLREELPDAGIVAIHTLGEGFVPAYEAGSLPPSVALHQAICDHYGVPAINVGEEVYRHMVAEGLAWEEFFADGAHPADRGHAHYADTIIAALSSNTVGHLPPCPPPRAAQVWRSAGMIPGDRLPVGPEWIYRERHLWGIDMHEQCCAIPGVELMLPFSGRVLGLLVVRQRMTGIIAWSVDGGPEKRCVLWDEYCPRFERASYEVLADDLPPGAHTLKLRLTDEIPKGGSGTACDLFGAMTATFE